MLFKIITGSIFAATNLTAAGSQVILSDSFTVSMVTENVNLELSCRQSGMLATQTYAKGACESWQIQMNDEISGLHIYPTATDILPRLSIDHNFTETGEFHFRATLDPDSSSHAFATLGGAQYEVSPAGGVSFQVYSNGNVRLASQGATVNAASTNFSTGSHMLDVYVSTPATFDGTGTASIHATIDGELWDLNGSAEGYRHSLPGFCSNYITLGARSPNFAHARICDFWLFDRTPLHGVSWFHCFTGTNDYFGLRSIEELSPAYFQHLAPYYGDILSKNLWSGGSTSQSVMDQQLDYCIAAGLDYIVWDSYPQPYCKAEVKIDEYGLQTYLASSRKTQIPFCLNLQGPAAIPSQYDWTLNLLTNAAYFKVLDNRPLVFVYRAYSYLITSNAPVIVDMIEYLSSNCVAVGYGDPYFVANAWTRDEIDSCVETYGDTIDAYYRYAGGPSPGIWQSCMDETRHKYLFPAGVGWDPFPRQECNVGAYGRNYWHPESTPEEIREWLNGARMMVNEHPLSAEVPAITSFGWCDMGEGARVIPSLFKGVDRINAFAEVAGADGVSADFELGTTMLNDGWSTIDFTNSYDYPPVVILSPPSYSNSTPVATRVRNITRTNFQARIQEWECYDGMHSNETVHWVAIPPGTYTIDGQRVHALKAWVTDDLRLFEDEFYVTNNTNIQDVNYHIDVGSSDMRQKGFLAYSHVIDYSCGPNGNDWQQQVPNNNSFVRLYANNNLASITPDYNFKDTGRFRIEVETRPDAAEYSTISFGGQNKNDSNPSSGFAVRIYSNGNIRCWSNAGELTSAATNISAATYFVSIRVDTPGAFDGSGTAFVRMTVNDIPIDLNGPSSGLLHSLTGLADNYITLGAYSSGTAKGSNFYYLKLYDENQFTFVPTDRFDAVPIVLAQVETDYNTNAVTPRVCSVSTNGFLVYLQSQETNALFASDAYQVHSGEITGFVLIEPGESSSEDFEAGTAGAYAGRNWVNFGIAPVSNARFFATLNTWNSSDTVVLRCENLGGYGVHLRSQEEISYDAETIIYPTENAGWVVFGE